MNLGQHHRGRPNGVPMGGRGRGLPAPETRGNRRYPKLLVYLPLDGNLAGDLGQVQFLVLDHLGLDNVHPWGPGNASGCGRSGRPDDWQGL